MKQIISAFVLVIIIVGFIVISFTFQQVDQERNNLILDLQHRSALLTENAKEQIGPYIGPNEQHVLPIIVDNFVNRQRVNGLIVYNNKDTILASSSGFPKSLSQTKTLAATTMDEAHNNSELDQIGNQKLFLYAVPIEDSQQSVIGSLVLTQNASYIDTTIQSIWQHNFMWVFIHTFLISLAIIIIILWIIYQPINNLVTSIKKARTGKLDQFPSRFPGNFFLQPLINEVTHISKSLREARMIASQEARLRIEKIDSPWTAERLKEFTKSILKGKQIYVISNREPYIHTRQGNRTTYYQPASGMVTALEPIMRACGGLWIAHGAGSADRETVDKNDKISVPPEDPKYSLRRVWINPEEEKGYYNGFSNEGLWPLCHMAHTRPIFRKEDWEEYKKVNGKFAEALLQEIKNVTKPLILIQDYHFAVLPRMIKNARPDAIIGIFWHIPWPHSEAFRICPWRKELLDGMLGADLLGFHTQLHCNNFIDTVSKELEVLIDLEQFAIQRKDHISHVKPFPISIPVVEEDLQQENEIPFDRQKYLNTLNIRAKYIGVGVDRLDYTKGILERLQAVEYFLKHNPSYKENFTFIQIAAPSRSTIPHYYQFEEKVEKEVQRINDGLQTDEWKPIILFKKHHTHEEINKLYKVANICLVTSLHDGMNLVAKEFIMARTDEKGVLVLSQFAGASQELKDSLIVNPYSIEQMGDAIQIGLTMPQSEQIKRMKRLREIVVNYNVYRWSAELLKTLLNLE